MRLPPRLLEAMPGFARRWALSALFAATADAFGRPMPSLAGLPYDDCLRLYAAFSRDAAEAAIAAGDTAAVEARLYGNACRLGRRPARLLRPAGTAEVLATARALYRAIGIDLAGNAEGEVTVRHCYFSRHYSAAVCRLMAGMDRGVLAGLSGGGQLAFSERITEGRPCCRARFTLQTEGLTPRRKDAKNDGTLVRADATLGGHRCRPYRVWSISEDQRSTPSFAPWRLCVRRCEGGGR